MIAATDASVSMVEVSGLPPPASHYADATILGDQIFVSGLLALDVHGRLVGEGSAAAQAEHIFAAMLRILAAAGSTASDVAKLTIFVLDLTDRAAINEIRKQVFGTHRPASTLVQVSRLIGAGTLVEIEAVAAIRRQP